MKGDKTVRIAIDVDGVLADSGEAMRNYVIDRQAMPSQFASDKEKRQFWEGFVNSRYSRMINRLPGSRDGIERLAKEHSLYIITNRHLNLTDLTIQWIEDNYPNIFKGFGMNKYGEDVNKVMSMRDFGCTYLIDDTPKNIYDVTQAGLRGILHRDWDSTMLECKRRNLI